MAVADFGGTVQRQEDRDRQRRPPEQARCRRRDRPPVVRPGRRRRDRRRADLERRARGAGGGAREEQGVPDLGRRLVRPDRQGLRADLDPLDLRHRRARQRHRQRGGQGGRRHLVLHHRRLRLRPRAASATPPTVVKENGGKVLGSGRGAAQHRRFLLVPAAGAGLEGASHRPRQCRRRHDQLDQAGGRVRHRRGRPEARRAAGLHHRRPQPRPARPRRGCS